jgi:flavin-dependent dehydrogenase
MPSQSNFDVVICGGGLAGLTLARQLKMELPALSVAVIDRLPRPLREAAHKVGEASAEVAAHYFGNVLQLHDYFSRRHLPKLALRFFFGDARGPFEKRPELGPSLFAPLPTYQIDRGRLENDLREMVADMGVELLEDTAVEDIALKKGAEPHVVLCRRNGSARQDALHGRWVIDALGRRRMLQSKLGLGAPNGHSASSAWWRIEPRLDLCDMAADADLSWRNRIIEDRNLSTTHLMGHGYWIWLIPLASNSTSIGIVTDETIHPVETYGKSYAQSLAWLEQHEPALWRLTRHHEPLDFHRLKNFSYHARQIFSHQRWCCTGEAGLFLDPLYSIGSDLIGIENSIIVEMIGRERRGELSRTAVDDYNRLVLDLLVPIGLAYYKNTYRAFGHAHIFAAKLIWDAAINYAVLLQVFVQKIVRRPTGEALDVLRQWRDLHERVQQLFGDWADAAPARTPFVYSDPTKSKFLRLVYLETAARRDSDYYVRTAKLNLDRMEELAQILFWQAVEECLPAHMPRDRANPPWINAWKISLDPERWEVEGLYEASTAPRSLRPMRAMLAGVFAPCTWQEYLRVELPYRIGLTAKGRPQSALVRFVLRRLIRGKPAMWLRPLFVTDQPSIPSAAAARDRAVGQGARPGAGDQDSRNEPNLTAR